MLGAKLSARVQERKPKLALAELGFRTRQLLFCEYSIQERKSKGSGTQELMRSLEKPKEIALVRHRLAGLFSIKGSLRRAYPFPSLIQLASMSDCEAECPTMGRHSHHLPEGKDRSHSGRRSLAWCGDVSSI